jgi:hypothetical protein
VVGKEQRCNGHDETEVKGISMAKPRSLDSLNRRCFLKAGAIGLGGLALTDAMAPEARPAHAPRFVPIYPRNNIGREIIPFQIVNQTGRDDVFFYVVGTTDPVTPAFKWFHLTDGHGNVTKCVVGNNQTYSMPLPQGNQTIWLPRLSAIRVYFSFGKKLYLDVGANNGIPTSPAGWLPDTNYHTLFDWIELTWEKNLDQNGAFHDFTLGGNSTQVDMFGLPMALALTGFGPLGNHITVQGGFRAAGVRNNILQTIEGVGDPWRSLVVTDQATGFAYRVISPYHGMELNLFPRNQLDDYINAVWNHYQSHPLMAFAVDTNYVGQVAQAGPNKGKLVFENNARPAIIFNKPTGFTVYTSGPLPETTGPRADRIGATLQAAFMRSTLLTHNMVPFCDSSAFYQADPVNLYAKTFHHFADGAGAYAFGFDDVCEKSSFIIVHNPLSLQITMLGF